MCMEGYLTLPSTGKMLLDIGGLSDKKKYHKHLILTKFTY